ncbi:MAG: hypothetical protein QOK32_1745 [Gaiellaceae bacterium]|nr:hypothetical protein [Gaiellaceae bacterium]
MGRAPWRTYGGLFAIALLVYALESLAWPLSPGRDANLYLTYYAGLGDVHPVYPELMLFVMPVAPLLFGALLDIGGANLAELAMGIAFAGSIVALVAAASTVSRRVGLVCAVALLAYTPYGAVFHQVSSDAPFACGLALWALAVLMTVRRPTLTRFALHGAAVFVLVLIRPSSELLLLPFAVVPLVMPLPLRQRALSLVAFLGVAAALLAVWSTYNRLRFDDFTVSRTSAAQAPFYHLFVYDKLIDPSNGPASRDLADAVQRDLLPREPYRSYRIDTARFFDSGSSRMWSDLVSLSDRRWGWNSDYRHLRSAGFEAIRRHPLAYLRGVAGTARIELGEAYDPPAFRKSRGHAATGEIVIAGRRVPAPTEGQPIPASRLDWLASTPDASIVPDWTSLRAPRLRYVHAGAAARAARIEAQVRRFDAELPSRDGSSSVASALDAIARLYPRPPLWLAVGFVAALWRRGRGLKGPLILCGLALWLLIGTAFVQPPKVQYRIPLDPILIVFAVAAVLGPRRDGDRPPA